MTQFKTEERSVTRSGQGCPRSHSQIRWNRWARLIPKITVTVFCLVVFIFDCAYASGGNKPIDIASLSHGALGWRVIGVKKALVSCDLDVLPDGSECLRLRVLKAADPDFFPQILKPLGSAVKNQDLLRLHFFGRSADSLSVMAAYGSSKPPYDKALFAAISLTPTWKEYSINCRLDHDIPSDGSSLSFFLPAKVGRLEIKSINFENWGNCTNPPPEINRYGNPYAGAELPPDWWNEAQNRIERFRKTQMTITVVDAKNQPVEGASIHTEQKKQKFHFGTAIRGSALFDQGVDGNNYRNTILRLFNTVVLENELKWRSQDWEQPDTIDKILLWCRSHALSVRGHHLFCPTFADIPQRYSALRGDGLKLAVRDHVHDYASRFRGQVFVWDAVNEACHHKEVTDIIGTDITSDCFKWAREADPDVQLAYNDYEILDEDVLSHPLRKKQIFDFVSALKEGGAPVTTMGMQAHMRMPLTRGDRIWTILDQFSQLNLPIEITEYDFGSMDDGLQADYLKEFMTAVFSHPKTDTFMFWGFWEGAHFFAKDGAYLIDKNWTSRKALSQYEQLVLRDWRSDSTIVSDRQGQAALKVFLGEHTVVASKGGLSAQATVTADSCDQPASLTLILK